MELNKLVVKCIALAARSAATATENLRKGATMAAKDAGTEGTVAERNEAVNKAYEEQIAKLDKNHRAIWRDALLCALDPSHSVETGTQGTGDKKSVTFKAADKCKTVRELTAAGQQLREKHKLLTKQAEKTKATKNAKAKKKESAEVKRIKALTPVELAKKVCSLDSKGFTAFVAAMHAKGYRVTAEITAEGIRKPDLLAQQEKARNIAKDLTASAAKH